MPRSPDKKAQIKARALEEFKHLAALTFYLASLLCGFALYRHLILAEYHISYFRVSYNLIEALVLAKVILIGEALHLGDFFHDRRLIVVTLYKTVVFSLLVFVFAVVEHFAGGLFEGRTIVQSYHALSDIAGNEVLSRVVILCMAFVPLFAVLELGELAGQNNLFHLFFRRPAHSDKNGFDLA